MKKLFILGAIGTMAFATSCKKVYTCECTVLGVTTTAESTKMSKADAEEWCEAGSAGLCTLN